MERKEIKEKVIEKIKDLSTSIEDEEYPETRFLNNLGFDSLDMVELIIRLEDEFEFGIPDIDAEDIVDKTIGHVIDYIDVKTR